MPPPSPCSTRKAISSSADVGSAHSPDPSPKSAIDAIQAGLDPKRSVILPDNGITAASDSR
jgi:hypothetical protein